MFIFQSKLPHTILTTYLIHSPWIYHFLDNMIIIASGIGVLILELDIPLSSSEVDLISLFHNSISNLIKEVTLE